MFVRLILLAILFFLGYTLYHALRRGLSMGPPQRPDSHSPKGEQMVQDAHDGTYIPISQAVTARQKGETLYFASKENRDAYFDKNT